MSDAASLERVLDEARSRWPGVVLDPEVLRARLAGQVAQLHGVDLYLALACEQGDGRAIALFQERFGPEVEVALRGQQASDAFIEEVRQALWERLFVPRGGAPAKIGTYSGRGSLAGWVRVAATRTALDLRHQSRKEVLGATPVSGDMESPAPGQDPERALLQARYQGEFKAALEAAIAALSAEERNVLRLHFLDGLGIDAIGRLYGIHRATAARWISRARETLLDGTLRRLRQRLGVSEAELESLVGLVQSQLDVSLGGLLRQPGL